MTPKTKNQKTAFIATLLILFWAIATFAYKYNKQNPFAQWHPKDNVVFTTTIQKAVAKNGLNAWLIEDPTTPIVAVSIVFKGGNAIDDDDKNGLSYIVSALLSEGAGNFDSEKFNDILEDNAIKMSFSADFESFSASLEAPQEKIATAFKMLSLALTEPRFDDEPFKRTKDIIKISLNKQQESPAYMASWEWRKQAFPNHSYARQTPADIKSLENITKKDLQNYIQNRFAKDNIFISAAGSISKDELSRLIDENFKKLPEKSILKTIPKPEINNFKSPVVIKMPVPQSFAVFGNRGIDRKDKYFYPAYIMNHILGGGSFSSRIMEEVRSKQGLAYSVGTSLNPSKNMPLIIGTVSTSNRDFQKSMETIKTEWQKMYEIGVTDKELAFAKDFLIASFPLKFNSSMTIADMLSSMQFEDLGIDFFNLRNSYIAEVTKNDIDFVAKRLLVKDPLFVVAGDPFFETNK